MSEDKILGFANHRAGFMLYPEFDRQVHASVRRLIASGLVTTEEKPWGVLVRAVRP